MTYGDMTVRQFLNGVREAKTEVLNLQRKLLELKTASENITAHWKDVPGGGSGSDPHKDEIVNALCDLNTSYGEKVLAYLRYMEETEAFIDTVSGFENRLILQLRYEVGHHRSDDEAHGDLLLDTAHHKTPRVRASGGGESVGSLEGDRET